MLNHHLFKHVVGGQVNLQKSLLPLFL